jgi:hypothetical protein
MRPGGWLGAKAGRKHSDCRKTSPGNGLHAAAASKEQAGEDQAEWEMDLAPHFELCIVVL